MKSLYVFVHDSTCHGEKGDLKRDFKRGGHPILETEVLAVAFNVHIQAQIWHGLACICAVEIAGNNSPIIFSFGDFLSTALGIDKGVRHREAITGQCFPIR